MNRGLIIPIPGRADLKLKLRESCLAVPMVTAVIDSRSRMTEAVRKLLVCFGDVVQISDLPTRVPWLCTRCSTDQMTHYMRKSSSLL
jgi:hypothetical protein